MITSVIVLCCYITLSHTLLTISFDNLNTVT